MGLPTLKTTQVKSGFSFKTLTRVKVEVKESFTGKAEMILRGFPEKRNLDENLVSSEWRVSSESVAEAKNVYSNIRC